MNLCCQRYIVFSVLRANLWARPSLKSLYVPGVHSSDHVRYVVVLAGGSSGSVCVSVIMHLDFHVVGPLKRYLR